MKTARKAIMAVMCVLCVIVASITGTLAYLTDDDAVVNTFTVGNVRIDLHEADLSTNAENDRTVDSADPSNPEGNDYHLLPGQTYVKDPTVKIIEGSEESYVRMLVKVSDIAKLKAAFPAEKYTDFYNGDLFLLQMLVEGWDKDTWQFYGANTAGDTYEFRYATTVTGPDDDEDNDVEGTDLDALFDKIVIPGTVNNAELANLQGVTITVEAHAIQKAGFDTADLAWTAFNDQLKISAPTDAIP